MPVLNLQVLPAPGDERRRALAQGLAALSTRILGKKLPLTAVVIDEPRHWFIANEPPRRPTAFLEIHISAGTNTADEKASFVEAAFVELQQQLGELEEVSYVVVHEVPRGDWGWGGVTQAARLSSQG
jgi:4-oxalocrotonate tautomerase